MLKYELNRAESILIIMPGGPLESADFEKLIQKVSVVDYPMVTFRLFRLRTALLKLRTH